MKRRMLFTIAMLLACGGTIAEPADDARPVLDASPDAPAADGGTDSQPDGQEPIEAEAEAGRDTGPDVCWPAMQACPDAQ